MFCLKKLINSTLPQSWLQMSIRSAVIKIYAKYSSGGTRLWWRRWNELRNWRNKQSEHERALNFYCRLKIGKIDNIQQNTTSKHSASFGRKKNEYREVKYVVVGWWGGGVVGRWSDGVVGCLGAGGVLGCWWGAWVLVGCWWHCGSARASHHCD